MPTNTKKSPAPHIYLFHGPDTFSLSEKIAAWKNRFAEKYSAAAINVFDCEEMDSTCHPGESRGRDQDKKFVPGPISSLKSALSSHTLFSAISLVIIKNPFSKNAVAAQELLCSLLPTCSEQTFVVLSDDTRDARSELSKLLTQLSKKGICTAEEFIVPTGAVLKKWITTRTQQYGGMFAADALTVFLECADGVTLWQLDMEIQKLISYATTRAVTVEDIEQCACLPVSGHIFDMSDALIAGNTCLALRHAHLVLGPYRSAIQGPILKMLAFLLTQFRSFLMLKSMTEAGKTEAQIADTLSWSAKRVWVVEKKLARHSQTMLKNAFAGLMDLERTIKTGHTDPLLALDLWVARTTNRQTKIS